MPLDRDVRDALLAVARDAESSGDGMAAATEAAHILDPLAERGEVSRDDALRIVMAVGGLSHDVDQVAEVLDSV